MLFAFFDDSGTHLSSPVVALGGLLGTEDQWNAFNVAWANLLKNPAPGKPSLKQFHLSACRSGNGEFRTYNQTERDFVTTEFRNIILDTGFVTVAAAVDRLAWNELVIGPILEELGQPEEFCFVKCVDSVIGIIRTRKPWEKLIIGFDTGTRKRMENWARLYKSQSARYPEIHEIGFARVSEMLPLQGADMIALETYQYAQEWLKTRQRVTSNPHFQNFIYRDLSLGLILDRDLIEEAVARVKAHFAGTPPSTNDVKPD